MSIRSESEIAERMFKGLADRTRLRLLNLMADREVCVCHFVEVLGIAQPKVSRHLAYLRRAGLVTARREGKWIHYRIADAHNKLRNHLLTDALCLLATDKQMQKDLRRLSRTCCAPKKLVQLLVAPPAAEGLDSNRTRELQIFTMKRVSH